MRAIAGVQSLLDVEYETFERTQWCVTNAE
jgi:hypothetical protein